MQCWLKCDADGCDHQEDVPWLTADMVGKPCPKCGANLLTDDDFKAGVRMKAFLDALSEIGLVKDEQSESGVSVSINPHNGKTNIVVGDVGGE